jgi:hypothetical protein
VAMLLISAKMGKSFSINFDIDIDRVFTDVGYQKLPKYTRLVNPESKPNAVKFICGGRGGVVVCNQPWHTMLYKSSHDFVRDTREVYRKIYTQILVQNDKFMSSANELLYSFEFDDCIGVQIRCGDYSWTSNDNVYLEEPQFKHVANRIVEWINKHGMTRKVYLTSDNKKFLKAAVKVLESNNIHVFSYSVHPIHFKDATPTQVYDIIMDHYLLSRCSQYLICNDLSNYGMTAALISGSDNVWSFNKGYDAIKRLKFRKRSDLVKGMSPY